MSTDTQILTGSAAAKEGDADLGAGGFSRLPRDPRVNHLIAEAWALWDRAVNHRSYAAMGQLQEAMSTSDFPLHLTAAFDRQTLARYEDITPVWSSFVDRGTVSSFREEGWLDIMGGKAGLERVREGGEYPARSISESEWKIKVGKFGGRFQITWETFVNDRLGAFNDLPGLLSQAARDTEDITATNLLVTSSGINTSFFKSANGNAPASVALTQANLEAAITAIKQRKDSQGRPVVTNRGLTLVVPPALETTARRILNASEIRTVDGDQTVIEPNYLRGAVQLAVNPWLDVVWTGANVHKTWFLLPTPGGPRPALRLGFLRGHEVPDLRVKSDTGKRVGGGDIPAEEGSFHDDTHQIRVRHVIGGAPMEPKATYASTGP